MHESTLLDDIASAGIYVWLPSCECDGSISEPDINGIERCYYCGAEGVLVDEVDLSNEIEKADRVILASEDWAKNYTKNKDGLAKLIKIQARFSRIMRKYFKDLADKRLDHYINWLKYNQAIMAYDIQVTVDELALDDEEFELLTVIHQPILSSMSLGAMLAEEEYNIDLGLNQFSDAIMKATDKHIGELVTGVTSTTKDRIKQSIKTSINNREDKATAMARLNKIVKDPRRAELIARTESVSAYNKGISIFAKESNATAKIWQLSSDPCTICLQNDVASVGIDDNFPSGDNEPPAHPNCRCGMSLVHDYSEKQ